MPINDGLEYGDTDKGFIAPRYPDIREWIVRRALERFGKNTRTEPTSRIGWVIDRIAWAMFICFLAALGAYNANFYATAQGVSLDKQLALVAFFRLLKKQSKGELVLFGDDFTVVQNASRVATEDTGAVFATDVEAVIGKKVRVVELTQLANTGDNWFVTVNGDLYAYEQLVDDTLEDVARGLATAIGLQATYFAGYLAPRDDAHMLVVDSLGPDLAVSLTPPAAGDGETYFAVRVAVTSADYGPVQGFAGTINKIKNPVTGWVGAANQRDVTLGRLTETDAQYRARWDRERSGPGKSTAKAMRRAFAATEELRERVEAIRIEELPTQWFKTIILTDLADDEIAQIIWDNKPLGVATEGADQGIAKNENNPPEDKVVKFQRATETFVWLKISITKGEGFPLIGDPSVAIAREVATWGNGGPSPSIPFLAYAGLGLGGDLDRYQLGQPINRACPGVKNATITIATKSALEPPPDPGDYLAQDYITAQTEILRFSSDRITVTIL
jgi:hypothetical protein